jgi:hypothetical protein
MNSGKRVGQKTVAATESRLDSADSQASEIAKVEKTPRRKEVMLSSLLLVGAKTPAESVESKARRRKAMKRTVVVSLLAMMLATLAIQRSASLRWQTSVSRRTKKATRQVMFQARST